MLKKLIVFLLFASMPVDAVDIGSDTSPTRFNGQQMLNNGDRIAGFAWLAGGFAFNGRTVTGIFDSVFPVLGPVNLNYGTLNLNQDLHLNDVTEINNWGNITGNFHILDLPAMYNCFPLDPTSIDACTVSFQSNLSHGAQVNSVSISFDNAYVASGTNVSAGNEVFVDAIVNNALLVNRASAAFTANVQGVDWHPTKYWIAVAMLVSGAANNLFNYSFTTPNGPLTQLSSASLGGGGANAGNAVAWHTSGLWLAVGRNSANGSPKVSIFPVNSGTGVIGAVASSDSTTNNQCFSVAFNTAGTFLAAGTATGGGGANNNQLRVYSFNSGTGAIALVASVALGAQVNGVAWGQTSSSSSYIAVGVNFVAAAPVSNHGLLIYKFNGVSTLTQVAFGVTSVNVNEVSWSSASNCLAAGLASSTVQVFNFDPTSNTLSTQDSVGLSGSALSVSYSPNGQFLASGDAANNVSLSQVDQFFIDLTIVTFNNLFLRFNHNSTLNTPRIAFSGNSVLDGRDNVISFSPTFTLFVEPSSSLLIKNITIQGLSQGQLLVDNSSTVSFQDVLLVLDSDYTFSSGRFEILKNLEIAGSGHSFIYSTTVTSLIRSFLPSAATLVTSSTFACNPGFNGTLTIDPGVTFQYSSTNTTGIQFEGANAQWIFNSATFITNNTLQLTVGRLVFDGKTFLQGAGSLIIGDGFNAADDLTVEIKPAANVIVSNTLIYRNI